ncbi:MAG: DUF3139 domain-containing protein [Clostridium paraputrificum]
MRKYVNLFIFILLFGIIFVLGKNIFFAGNAQEKERILSETVWQLAEEGYKKDDIKSIEVKYDPLKGGVLPFNYKVYVVFKNNPSQAQIYSWVNDNKNGVENTGFSSAE